MSQSRSFQIALWTLLILISSCHNIGNHIDRVRLECGESLPDSAYVRVVDQEGHALKKADIEVLFQDDSGNEPEPYSAITINACLQIPPTGTLFIRHRLADIGAVKEAADLQPTTTVPLTDLADQKLQLKCEPQNVWSVSRQFSLRDILIKKVQPELEKTFKLEYRFEGESAGPLTRLSFPVPTADEGWRPFKSLAKDGLYKLNFTVRDLLQPKKAYDQTCVFSLDNSPPELDLLLSGSPNFETLEVLQTPGIMLVKESDSLEFKQVDGDDTKEIQYCLEALDDSKADEWRNTLASDTCHSTVNVTKPHNPLRLPTGHKGFWAIKYRSVDQLDNTSKTMKVQPILLYNAGAIELARSLAETISSQGMVLGNASRLSLGNALRSEHIRNQLPTRFERDAVAAVTRNALITVLGDNDFIAFTLEGSRKASSPFSGGTFPAALSADRSTLVQGTPFHGIRLYSTQTGQVTRKLPNQGDTLLALAISPDGKLLATQGSLSNTVNIWNVEKGGIVQNLEGNTAAAGTLAFSPDGQRLAAGLANGTVTLWNLEKPTTFQTYPNSVSDSCCLSFSSDSQTLATALADGTIQIRDLRSDAQPKTLKASGTVTALLLIPERTELLVGTSNGKIKRWNYASGTEIKTYAGHFGAIKTLSITRHEERIAFFSAARDTTAKEWDLDSDVPLQSINNVSTEPNLFQEIKPGSTIAIADAFGFISIRSLIAKPRGIVLEGRKDNPLLNQNPTFSRDGQCVAGTSSDFMIRIWDANTARFKTGFKFSGSIQSFALSPDHRQVITGPFYGAQSELWDMEKETVVQTFNFGEDWATVKSLAVSPDNTFAALGTDAGGIMVFKTATGELAYGSKAHGASIETLSISPNSQFLATGSNDKKVKIWDLATGKMLHELTDVRDGIAELAFSSDSKMILAAGRDKSLTIWNLPDGTLLKALGGEILPLDGYHALFSQDRSLIFWAHSAQMEIWSVKTGVKLSELSLPDAVKAISTLPNGNKIRVLLRNDELVDLNFENANLVEKICNAVGQYFTNEETSQSGNICGTIKTGL